MTTASPVPPPADAKPDLEEGTRFTPRFDAAGLITAVVTDASSGDVLMVAHMNAEALDLSILTGIAHYYSRSRRTLWKKGETSGALQTIREMRVDCDQDALWLRVDVTKPDETCHTHRASCFYRLVSSTGDGRTLAFDPALSPHKSAPDA
jgi:phosphoribosyl-AMP cyclohydrolase